jgi:KDO2-lipid IV(A) lauroyltransferase
MTRAAPGLDLLASALRLPGPRASSWLGAGLGSLAAGLLRDRRTVALTQIGLALPELDAAAREQVWRRSLRHQGRNLCELAQLAGSPAQRERLLAGVEVTGQNHFDQALELAGPGRGLVVVTAHLGNWEICLAALAARGHRVSVVHHGLRRPRLSAWLGEVRAREGDVELVELGTARAGRLLASIRAGRHLVAAMDQNARRDEGEFAPFFGAPACTRRGPVVLASRLGVPLLPVLTHRVGRGPEHRIEFQPPIELPSSSGGLDAVVEDGLARVNRVIEAGIRAHPEQWIWSHRRFKTCATREEAARFEVTAPATPARRKRRRR